MSSLGAGAVLECASPARELPPGWARGQSTAASAPTKKDGMRAQRRYTPRSSTDTRRSFPPAQADPGTYPAIVAAKYLYVQSIVILVPRPQKVRRWDKSCTTWRREAERESDLQVQPFALVPGDPDKKLVTCRSNCLEPITLIAFRDRRRMSNACFADSQLPKTVMEKEHAAIIFLDTTSSSDLHIGSIIRKLWP